jgi:dCTP deaminase
MILSDGEIKIALRDKKIIITPEPDLSVQLGPCSVDLRLGSRFRVFNYSKIPYLDPQSGNSPEELTVEITVKKNEPFILHPGDFVLATTLETIILPDYLLARLEGRSSLGRLGIVVHSTASVIDPGFRGVIVMELGNLGRVPVALYPGMRICAVTFDQLTGPAEIPYHKKKNAKYSGQNAPLASRIDRDKMR